MKKKLLSLVFFAIAICLSISIGASVTFASVAESTKIEIYSAEYFSNVNRSVELHERAISSYIARTAEYNGKKFTVYNDDFAGVYIDEQGFLNIAVVGESESKSQQILRDSGQVLYKQVAFSYNYLQSIMNAIESIMELYSIRTVGIDDFFNLVFVEMSDEKNIAPIIEYLQIEGLYNAAAFSFEIDPKAKTLTDADRAYGGESLYHWISPTTVSRGTICVNAIDNTTGQLGVLTNEHVALAANSTAMVYGGHFNGMWFNTATAIGNTARGQQGGNIDAAFVPYANQQDWEITPYGRYGSTTYSNVLLGNNNQIVRGQPVRRIGQTTGITTGEIRSTNATVTVDGVRITNTFRYTNDGQGGDSGGPVYFDDGTNLHLIGIHFASGDVFLGGRQGIACRIQNVMDILNVTPITNSSFNTTNLSGGGIELNRVNVNPSGAFVIPAELGGRAVTSIGASAFSNQNDITRIEIPTSVTEIKSSAFSNRTSITEVIFEATSNVQTIGNSAFSGCTSLSILSIPSSVTSIGSNAFENCTSLTSVTLSNNLTSIGNSAFKGCTSLTNVSIPNSVTSIGTDVFRGCSTLTSITIPPNVTSIADNTFKDCTRLISVSIPNNVTSIESSAFENCYNLTNIVLPSNLTTIGSKAFQYCKSIINLTIPSSVTSIGSNAFLNCHKLNNITIPQGINVINDSTFANCYEFTNITIPSSVTSIGYNAFGGCVGLTNIVIPSNVTSIGSNAFINCTGLIGITFPPSVRSIGSSAFGNCIGLANVTIPSTVTSVGSNAFSGCNNLSITWNYNPVLSAYGFKDNLTNVVFPSYVTSISNYAFKDCSKITSINIPDDVTSIGYEAFRGCTSLTGIILPDGITYIADSTFFGCFSLTSIILPEGLETISDSAFYKCYSLTTVNLPESVTYMGFGVFGECESLTSITIPSGVNSIKPETFYYCLSLENVVISLGVEYIEFNAFRYCASLRTVTIPESVVYIGIQAFSYCSNLGIVHLKRETPDITLIDEYAFDNSNALINVSKKSFVEYKTSPDLEDYRNRIICTTLTEIGLDHYSFSDYILTKDIDVGNNEIIVIHVMDMGTYQIEASSNSAIQMAIYDEEMNLISTITYFDPSNTSGYIENTFTSFYEMCYLVISFTDPTVSGTIETSFEWLN